MKDKMDKETHLYEILDICIQCNKEYYRSKYTPNRKYCSAKCMGEANRRDCITICAYCEKELIRQVGRVKKYPTQYCNNKCKNEHYKIRFKGKKNPNYKNNLNYEKIKKICIQCNKEFIHYKKSRKYCSNKCYSDARNIECICTNCGEKFIKWKSQLKWKKTFCSRICQIKYSIQEGNITKKCEECKKEYTINKKFYKQRFCSNPCLNKWKRKSGMYKGKNNPRYEDGSSITKGYRGEDWSIQRKKAYERDNGMCQKCGEQIRVAIHHILPWKYSKDNSLTNLICLCPSCHMTEENYYRQFGKVSEFIRDSNIAKVEV